MSSLPIKKHSKPPNRYYRIIKDPLPSLSKSVALDSPQIMTERILRSQKFVYIDMNQQNGCKTMQKIDPDDSQEQIQKIGNNFITDLKNLSSVSQQTHDYLFNAKELRNKKDKLRKIVKQQLDHSLENISKRNKNGRKDFSPGKKKKKLQYDPQALHRYLERQELQTINEGIVNKQMKLVQKFGIVSDYNSVTGEKGTKKIRLSQKLPSLTYRTIQK